MFVRSLVRREKEEAQWGGVSFFTDDQGDEIMYFGTTGDDPDARAFFGLHNWEAPNHDPTPSTVRFETGPTYMMVGQLDLDAGEANLWINPPLGATPPAPDLTIPFAMEDVGKAVGSVRLNGGADAFITGDEIVVGTTWNDVVAVPEPTTLLLFAVGTLALLCWRRTR